MKNALVVMGVVVAVLVVLLVTPTAKAANFTHNGHVISLSGDIQEGDARRLSTIAEQTGIKTLFMSSNGGHAIEGFRLGYTINRLGLQTIVSDGDSCLSACAIAFLGGTSKVQAGILGFHVAWAPNNTGTFSEGMKSGQYFGTVTALYFFNMGYTGQLYAIVSQITDSETFLLIEASDLNMFEMVDNNFSEFIQLPERWVANRVADPLRLHLIREGI